MYQFISFRDPENNRSVGCCLVKANNPIEAIERTDELEIKPNGNVEALCFTIEECEREEENMELDRLYSKEEMLELGYQLGI